MHKITIFMGADHAGYHLKETLKAELIRQGYEVKDCGAFKNEPEDDYPDFIYPVSKQVARTDQARGIVLGKSGAGECMVANKVKGIRAFLAVNEINVKLAREHNDANVISLGSEILSVEEAKHLVSVFLATPFSGEQRHLRRIEKIKQIEDET